MKFQTSNTMVTEELATKILSEASGSQGRGKQRILRAISKHRGLMMYLLDYELLFSWGCDMVHYGSGSDVT